MKDEREINPLNPQGDAALRAKLNREVIRHAVQCAISCGQCGAVLDMRRAVLLTGPAYGGTDVACVACFDPIVSNIPPQRVAVLLCFDAIIDGRAAGDVMRAPWMSTLFRDAVAARVAESDTA